MLLFKISLKYTGIINSVTEQVLAAMNDDGSFDHNSSPEIQILYHPYGNMREFNFGIPNPPSQVAR